MTRTPSETNAAIGTEVKVLMTRHDDLTQQQLADEIGVSRPTISARLSGEKSWTVDLIEAVAAYFDVPFTDLWQPADVSRNRWSSDGVIDLRDRRSPSRVTPAPYAEATPASHIEAMDAA